MPNTASFSQPHNVGRQNLERRFSGRIAPLENILLIFGLVILLATFRAVLSPTQSGSSDREAGGALTQIINLSIYLPGLLLIFVQPPKWLGQLLLRSWPLVAIVALALASTFWSDSPSTTFRRAVALVLTTSFAFYVVSRWTLDEFLKYVLIAFGIYIVAGFVASQTSFGIVRIGIFSGLWQGFTGQKNEFGRILAFMFAFFIGMRWVDDPQWRPYWLAGVLLSFVLLIMSDSKTSLVSGLVAVPGMMMMRMLCNPKWGSSRIGGDIRLISAVLIIIALILLLGVAIPLVLEALNRDMTLSGRTKLWGWAIDINRDRPWLGAGYRAFWIDANTLYFFEFFAWGALIDGAKSDSFSGPANGHSGYIDTYLEMGYVGVALLVAYIFAFINTIRKCFERGLSKVAHISSLTLFFVLTYSVTERIILQQTEGVWFIFMVMYLYSLKALITQNVQDAASSKTL